MKGFIDWDGYAKAAEWCNANNATIEERDDCYEVVELVNPEPTAEELLQREADAAAATLSAIESKAFRSMLAGNSIAEYKEEYQSTLSGISDEVALLMADDFPEWDKDGHEYKVGDRVVYNGTLYKVLQAHTSQETWTPEDAQSLFAKVLTSESEILPWEQPGSTNPYMKGDKVTYNGKTYESLIDNNVWSPADYPAGWKEI